MIKRRKNRPIFLIDIAVPRNLDPEINKIDNVYLYDIDDLQSVVESNIKDRQKEAELAKEIIEEEIETFQTWLRSIDVVPTIVAIREKAEEIGQQSWTKRSQDGRAFRETEKAGGGPYPVHSEQAPPPPAVALKQAAGDPEGSSNIESARVLFGVEEKEEHGRTEESRHSQKRNPDKY